MDLTPRLLAVLVPLWTGGVSGCADIWGFQDGVADSTDGGTGAVDAGWLPDGAVAPADASEDSAACGLTCVAAPPPGWSGPYELSEAVGGVAGGCSDGAYPVEVYDGFAFPSAPPASCACTCGPVTGSQCEPPTITLYRGAMCSAGSQCATVGVSSGTCVAVDQGCGGTHMQVSASRPLPGTCAASAATNVPDAGWTASARLCQVGEPMSGQCAGGEVCVPPVASPFVSCIAMAELSPCPSGPYTSRRVYYGAATDTRACTECSCSTPSLECTGGTVATFGNPGCAMQPHVAWNAPQSCADIHGAQSAVYDGDAVPSSGPCTPVGGVPTGQLTPTSPTTICCTR